LDGQAAYRTQFAGNRQSRQGHRRAPQKVQWLTDNGSIFADASFGTFHWREARLKVEGHRDLEGAA
jgi:hypothetical protein